MSAAEDWEPSEYGLGGEDRAGYAPQPQAHERPEQWYRDNAAVFHALEEWQRSWDAHAYEYEHVNGRPPSSMNRDKNKAAFRRQLLEKYGRSEPDGAWVSERISHLEKRGMAPERGDRFAR